MNAIVKISGKQYKVSKGDILKTDRQEWKVGDKVKINELFDIVINETSLEKEIKFLIIYKKVLFNSDTESENNLIKMIDPLIKSDSIWKSHGLYLMAEYFYSKGEKQKSKEFYQQIINLENSNPKIKIETHKRLNRDFSE